MNRSIYSSSQLTIGIVGLILGILLIFIPGTIVNYLFICLGILIILQSIPTLLLAATTGLKTSSAIVSFILSIFSLILGIVLITSSNVIVAIIAGALLIAMPIYRIIVAVDKQEQFKKDIFKIALGVILVILGPGKAINLILQIVGGVLCAFCIYLIIYSLVITIKENKKEKKAKQDSEVIDM